MATVNRLPALPALPSARKARPVRPCACGGCGRTTKSTWYPGHDGHCMGWAEAIERGDIKLEDVPEMVRAGVANRLAFLRSSAKEEKVG